MKDGLGRLVRVGDEVAYCHVSSALRWFRRGVVEAVNGPHDVVVRWGEESGYKKPGKVKAKNFVVISWT